jgi:GTPase SAR1 family protein
VEWLKLFKQQNQAALIMCGFLAASGIVAQVYSLSGTKYDVIEYCFKPHRINNKKAKYCTDDKKYIAPLGFYEQEKYAPANPRFQREDIFVLSDKMTRLRTIPATNPQAKNYAIAGLILEIAATFLISQRAKRYKREFAAYFEQLKTDLNQEIKLNEQKRSLFNHKVAVETEYIKDAITDRDAVQRYQDKPPELREFESQQARLHNEVVELQRQVQLAKFKAEIAKLEADEAKFKSEASRHLSATADPLELAEEIDYKALCPGKVGELEFYDWRNLADDAVGIMVVGNSGSGKTSVASWIAGWLTKDKPAQVLALDPHANRNPLWNQLNIYVISDFQLIQRQLEILLEILDQRRAMTFEEVENADTIICFADELSACIKQFNDPNVVTHSLERLGCEGRKYKIVFIAMNQSINTKDNKDTSAAMLSNYLIIRLCAIARQISERWKKTDPRHKHVQETAYSCVICGSASTNVAVHPTHHSYKQYKQKGNKPLGLLPINQLPLTIQLASPQDIQTDWHEDLILWADELGRLPNPQEIKEHWEEMMGHPPSGKQVEMLHEYLKNRN